MLVMDLEAKKVVSIPSHAVNEDTHRTQTRYDQWNRSRRILMAVVLQRLQGCGLHHCNSLSVQG